MSIDKVSRRDVSIVGAGMSGCMMAMYLARRGYKVDLYERRSDMRRELNPSGRSINLTLAARAIAALDELGLKESILDLTMPLRGRMIHKTNGTREFQSYGNAPSDRLYSITRTLLNNALLDAAEKYSNIEIHFNVGCVGLDRANRQLLLRDEPTNKAFATSPQLVIGADGCYSKVCDAIQQSRAAGRRQEFMDWGYKEIRIPPTKDGNHAFEKDLLQIWPRGSGMLLAIPNPDGSFTGTLCLPFKGARSSFQELAREDALKHFCQEEFPDAVAVAPNLADGLASVNAASFVTVSADRWYCEDWAVLVGDACHTVLPFYGQGMNAALEDCSILARLLDAEPDDREKAFRLFQSTRKRNTDALTLLSRQNFVELRDAVRSPLVGYRKKVNLFLHRCLPNTWTPLYTLVSHTTIPYADAVRKAQRQDRVLRWSGVDLLLCLMSVVNASIQSLRRNTISTAVGEAVGVTRSGTYAANSNRADIDAQSSPTGSAATRRNRTAFFGSTANILKSVPWWTVAVITLAAVVTGSSRAGILVVINGALTGSKNHAMDYRWVFAALALLLLGSHLLSRLLLNRLSLNLVYEMRARLSRAILEAPLRDVEKAGTPALYSALTTDVQTLSAALLRLPTAVVHSTTILICAAYLGWLSPVGLLSLLLAVAVGGASYQMVVSKARSLLSNGAADQVRLLKHFRAVIEGNKELKLHNGRKGAFLAEALDDAAQAHRANSLAANNIYSVGSVWGQFLFFAFVGLILFWFANQQGIDRAAVSGVVLVLLYIMVPLELLLSGSSQYARASVALENLKKIGLRLTKPDISGKRSAPFSLLQRWGTIEMTGVEKRYSNESGTFGLGPIDIKLKLGEMVFVMGGNGSGKSTLVKLLTGLYSPDAGAISIESQRIDDDNREEYRQLFSVVFADSFLFDRLHGLYSHDLDERVQELLVRLQLNKVVTFSNGTFSSIDLSSGQRKRLALLVALIEDRSIFVFDEWAAEQDPEFRRHFYTQLLPELKLQGKTLVVVTHDDRYAHIADRIIRLEEGKLREPDAERDDNPELESGRRTAHLSSASRFSLASQTGRSAQGILSTIGNTPLVRLQKVLKGDSLRVYAKLEMLNPGGSIKDRSAWQIIEQAFATGQVTQATTVIEASSGNMGIGLAQVCAYFGLRFICVVDTRTTDQNIQILRAYGAKVEQVSELDSPRGDMLAGKLNRVQHLLNCTSNSFWPNQYANPNNANAHYKTMHEIVEQVGEPIDFLFCSTSTCGTLRGCSEYLNRHDMQTQIIAVDAIGSVISGSATCNRLLPGHGTSRVPELYDASLASRFVQVGDLDCVTGCRLLMTKEGILAGGSSGGVLMALKNTRSEIADNATCVIILPDRGDRYLDTIYSDQWVRKHFGNAQLPGGEPVTDTNVVPEAVDY